MPEIQWFIGIGAAVFLGLLVFATIYKLVEVSAARRWPATAGKVVSSKVQARKKRADHGGQIVVNYPEIIYEYKVGGRRYRGRRISVGEDAGNTEVAEILARYPAGAQVQVFYNPANPDAAVLERDLPPEFAKGITYAILFFGGGAIVLLFLFTKIPDMLVSWLPRSTNPFVATITGVGGLFVAFFAFILQRQLAMSRHWPATRGQIEAVEIESYLSFAFRRWRTFYRPRIVYTYEVEGRKYTGERVAFGALIGWGDPHFIRRTLSQYEKGNKVEVYYNPQNHSEAVLERRVAAGIFLWIVAGGLLMIAGAALGLF